MKLGRAAAMRWIFFLVTAPARFGSLDAMVLLVPGDEFRQSDADRRRRLIAEVAARFVDIGKAFQRVAGLQGQEALGRLAAEQRLDRADEIHQLLRAMVAEIIEAMPRPARPVPRPP